DLEIYRRLETGQIDRPSDRHASVPEELETICMRALAPDRAHRYATAAELQAAIEGFLDATSVHVGPRQLARTMAELFVEARRQEREEIDALLVAGAAPASNARSASSTASGELATSGTV